MAQQEEIVLWIDQRWKNAIEKHLKDETLQEHLENVPALSYTCSINLMNPSHYGRSEDQRRRRGS